MHLVGVLVFILKGVVLFLCKFYGLGHILDYLRSLVVQDGKVIERLVLNATCALDRAKAH